MIQKSEEIREKNFKAFEKRYGFRPQIAANEDNDYRMELAKNGDPILFIKGATPDGSDLRMNSEYDPDYEAQRWCEKFKFINRRTTVLFFGFGAGYHLRALIRKMRPDTMFYVFEPQESLFSFICGFIDIVDLINDSRVSLFVNEKQRGLYVNSAMMDVVTFNSETEGIKTPFYVEDKQFLDSCEAVSGIMSGQRNYQRERGRASLRCRIYAWTHMRDAAILRDLRAVLPADIPAVIVSAGPSLSKNVDVLKRIKGHAFIMCSDRALGVLDAHGIEPDVVLSAEPVKDPSFLKYKVADNIPLLCSMQANSEAQELFRGRCIYFHALHYENELFGERVEADLEGLDLGGNVSGACFVACEKLGIKTIILIGQDMAYLDGKHHADDLESGGDDAKKSKIVELPGALGGTVISCGMWREFRDFFERRIKLNPELHVIDATEGGALIRGSEVKTLEEVADELSSETYNLPEMIRNIPRAQTEDEYKETIEKFKAWCTDLDMIKKNASEITTLCEQLLKVCKYQDINDRKNKKKLDRLDNLRREIYLKTVNALLEEFWVEDVYSIPDYQFVIRTNEEAIPVFETAINYFSHLPEDCDSLKETILEAINA